MRVGRYQAGLIKCHSLRIAFSFIDMDYISRANIRWCSSLSCIDYDLLDVW